MHFSTLKTYKFKVIKLTEVIFCSMIQIKFLTGLVLEGRGEKL